jgi:hypothetical protein
MSVPPSPASTHAVWPSRTTASGAEPESEILIGWSAAEASGRVAAGLAVPGAALARIADGPLDGEEDPTFEQAATATAIASLSAK